jgi:hypothetical protein
MVVEGGVVVVLALGWAEWMSWGSCCKNCVMEAIWAPSACRGVVTSPMAVLSLSFRDVSVAVCLSWRLWRSARSVSICWSRVASSCWKMSLISARDGVALGWEGGWVGWAGGGRGCVWVTGGGWELREGGECVRGVVVEGDGGGVVCMGMCVCPGELVRLGEFRVMLLGVEGCWEIGLIGDGVRVVLLEGVGGRFAVCVLSVVCVCVGGEVVWRGESGLCWLGGGLGVGGGMGGIPWISSSSMKSPGWGWGGSGPRLRLVAWEKVYGRGMVAVVLLGFRLAASLKPRM